MQTDPVFAERAGFDSYDPYSYVASNPVNFTDPTGESWTWDALAKPFRIMGKNIGNGSRWAAAGMSGTVRTLGTNIGNGSRWAAKNGTREEALYFFTFFAGSGMSVEEFLFMYFAAKYTSSTEETWFGHEYSGQAGNHDPFNGYYTDFNSFAIIFIVLAEVLKSEKQGNLTLNEIASFLALVPLLSPKPKSFADGLGQRHDREWGGGSPKEIFNANNNYVRGWVTGIFTEEFWHKPVDSIVVGGLGAIGFGCMNYCALYYGY